MKKRPRPTVENFGLLIPVFNGNTVKLPVRHLKQAKLPGICPHCLEPGNITETFTITLTRDLGFQRQIQTIGVPISTHRGCSQGFTKKNISGSIKVWGEGDALGPTGNRGFLDLLAAMGGGGNICFTFKDPWYALLFTRINFPFLLDERGRSLLTHYDNSLSSFTSGSRYRFSKKCPRCACGIEGSATICPSCNLDLTGNANRFQRITEETVDINDNIDDIVGVARKCPDCDIIMLKEANVEKCPRCGTDL